MTASARFADASASHSYPLPLPSLKLQVLPFLSSSPSAHVSWTLAFAGCRHKSALINSQFNTCHPTSRKLRATPRSGRDHASLDSPLAVYWRIRPTPVRPLSYFVWIAASHVAYLSRRYSPSPGLSQASKYSRSFPLFASACSPPHLKHNARYELAAVPLEPRGFVTDHVATPPIVVSRAAHAERSRIPLASIHAHAHTRLAFPSRPLHTPSAAAAWITTRAHHSSSSLARVPISETSFGLFILFDSALACGLHLRNIRAIFPFGTVIPRPKPPNLMVLNLRLAVCAERNTES